MNHWQPSQSYPKMVLFKVGKFRMWTARLQNQIQLYKIVICLRLMRVMRCKNQELNSSGSFEYVKQTSTSDHEVKPEAEDDVQRQEEKKVYLLIKKLMN